MQWSPDGGWILVLDFRERLIVLPAESGAPAGLLANHAANPAWFFPGAVRYTIESPSTVE